jgi:hypothetical protein
MTLLPLALILSLSPADDPWKSLRPRVESAPRRVAKFIERRAGCNHFLGEEPYDAERSAELGKALRDLRCERVDRDGRRLTRAYSGRPEILQLLKDSEALIGW